MVSSVRRGRLVVISAPSGTGKSTVCRRLVDLRTEVEVSISYTTRAPRGTERDGIEYHFVDDSRFDELIESGAFLEWAKVHDQRYGTALSDVEALRDEGKDVLFDIDIQGGHQIKKRDPNALLVFVLPPSIDELIRRLTGRGTETEDQIRLRLKNAVWEMEQGKTYDCLVVNDDLEAAVDEVDRLRTLRVADPDRDEKSNQLGELLAEARRRLSATD